MSLLLMNERSTAPDTPSNGKRFIYPKSDGWYSKDDAGNELKITGAENLNDLTDVTVSAPSDGELLIYNDTTSKFENGNTTGSVFGSGAVITSDMDDPPASNSTATYATYLTSDNVSCVANKEHRIGAGVSWAMSVTNKDFEAILTVQPSGGTEVTIGSMNLRASVSGSDQKPVSYLPFKFVPSTTANHVFRLKYRPQDGSGTAYIHYAVIEAWRTEK